MTIKYGDLTIVHENIPTFLSMLERCFSVEETITSRSDFIFVFEEDQEKIYDTNDIQDFEYNFQPNSISVVSSPFYFEKKSKEKFYFNKSPHMKEDGNCYLNFDLFNNYKNYDSNKTGNSYYNCIYYYNKGFSRCEVLGIVYIKSSKKMPRYQFAYDDEQFTKEEVIYLIKNIFTQRCYY